MTDFHSAEAADRAAAAFEAKFTRGELSSDLAEVTIDLPEGSIGLPKLVTAAGLASSASDATRKIQQGAVKVDREKVADIKFRVDSARNGLVLEVGRRAVRIRFKGL